MTDLFNIPGDTGAPWRMDKMIEYHAIHGNANFIMLRKYIKNKGMTTTEKLWTVFLFSLCYNAPTTCLLEDILPFVPDYSELYLKDFWAKYRDSLIFQSDRRYVKANDMFVPMILEFLNRTEGKPAAYFKKFTKGTPQERYNSLYAEVKTWTYYGRVSTFLFIEAFDHIMNVDMDVDWFDWRNGQTATSGMLQVLYQDKKALDFDETGKLSDKDIEHLNAGLIKLKARVHQLYPNASTKLVDLESSLCGFRKFFKGTRYGWYYLDRQQEELQKLSKALPQHITLWGELGRIRIESFPVDELGELKKRKGTRPELNKQWLEKGVSGVEAYGQYKRV